MGNRIWSGSKSSGMGDMYHAASRDLRRYVCALRAPRARMRRVIPKKTQARDINPLSNRRRRNRPLPVRRSPNDLTPNIQYVSPYRSIDSISYLYHLEIMTRQFFVGGNFKLNPTTLQAGNALVSGLNSATLDPTTGESRSPVLFADFDHGYRGQRSSSPHPPSTFYP